MDRLTGCDRYVVLLFVFFGLSEYLFLFRASLIAYGATGFASGLAACLAFAATGLVVFIENLGRNSFDMLHG